MPKGVGVAEDVAADLVTRREENERERVSNLIV
jgi:hypothetical protein